MPKVPKFDVGLFLAVCKPFVRERKYPRFLDQYDGALALCGVVGGATRAMAGVLFDYFFPGVLLGALLHTPNPDFSPGSPTFTAVANALSIGLVTPGQPTLQFANVAGLPGSTPDEIVLSGITLVGDSLGFNELLQRTHGHNFYDNRTGASRLSSAPIPASPP